MTEQIPVKDKSIGAQHISVSAFRKGVKKTVPHKHNGYFEIVYLSAGSGYHLIDHQKYEVKPPVVFFVRREQVHGFELAEDCDPAGFVLIVKKPFIDQSVDGELKSLFAKVSNHACLYLNNRETIPQLFALLVRENDNSPAGNPAITEGLMKALLAKILEAGQPMASVNTAKSTDFYQSYLELLHRDKPIIKEVAHYAGLLNTTPQNLNAVCRKAVNQPAATVLAEFIISEAKRLLLYTHNTVAETAFALDFKDTSHFIKYFKRFTGLTPQTYRNIP
jgi:AraC-like DNA-binding protein